MYTAKTRVLNFNTSSVYIENDSIGVILTPRESLLELRNQLFWNNWVRMRNAKTRVLIENSWHRWCSSNTSRCHSSRLAKLKRGVMLALVLEYNHVIPFRVCDWLIATLHNIHKLSKSHISYGFFLQIWVIRSWRYMHGCNFKHFEPTNDFRTFMFLLL